jgi:hypothetical protein
MLYYKDWGNEGVYGCAESLDGRFCYGYGFFVCCSYLFMSIMSELIPKMLCRLRPQLGPDHFASEMKVEVVNISQ